MNIKAVKSFGLALMLAAGVLAVLLALGTFSPQKAAAQSIDPDQSVVISPGTLAAGTTSFFKVSFGVLAGNEILPGEEIVVSLPSFVLPGSIDASQVNIRTGSGDALQQGHPVNINTDATKDTITLQLGSGLQLAGAVNSVTFLRAAGIAAPLVAGSYDVNVSYADTSGKAAKFSVTKSVSIDEASGNSDTVITVSGAGFSDGTVKVYVTSNAGTSIASDAAAIATAKVSDGAFETTIKVKGNVGTGLNKFQNGDKNYIRVLDPADGALAEVGVQFELNGKLVLAGGNTLVKGTEGVKITLSEGPSKAAYVNEVTIGEVNIPFGLTTTAVAQASVSITAGEGVIYINVPSDLAAGADQALTLLGGENSGDKGTLGSAKVEVTSLALTATPVTAVQGTSVTVTGTGFKDGEGVMTLTIGRGDEGDPVEVDPTGAPATTGDGRLLATFTVPDLPAGDRSITLTQEGGRVGAGTLTVLTPSITINPDSGRLGSAVTVSGANFPANAPIFIDYGDSLAISSPRSDATGAWQTIILVPSNAVIGTGGKIKGYRPGIGAVGTVDTAGYIPAQRERAADKVQHTVPGSTTELSATEVESGDTITVTGSGFKPFSKVTAKVGLDTGTTDTTDSNGDFSIGVRVPLLAPGNQLLSIDVFGSPTETKLIKVVVPAPAPTTRAIADVFADLIAAGSLGNVFRYNNADKSWQAYNPALPELSDLAMVEVFDGLWVEVTEDVTFQNQALTAGWNSVTVRR